MTPRLPVYPLSGRPPPTSSCRRARTSVVSLTPRQPVAQPGLELPRRGAQLELELSRFARAQPQACRSSHLLRHSAPRSIAPLKLPQRAAQAWQVKEGGEREIFFGPMHAGSVCQAHTGGECIGDQQHLSR